MLVDGVDAVGQDGGAMTQPTRQPVIDHVFEHESAMTTRSAIPGTAAIEGAGPSNVKLA